MNANQLQEIFKQPFTLEVWQTILIKIFGASDLYKKPASLESDTNGKVDGFLLGELATQDKYKIGLFAFEIKEGTNIKLNRVGLRSLVRGYLKYNYDAAIVVYFDDKDWRLSFVCNLRDQETAPKRFTYVFGNPEESYRTASDRLAKLSEKKANFDNIMDAFSVQKLSAAFFDGYKVQYNKFCNYIGGNEKWERDYVKKMMGRLVFLQFLQKKGWMGCKAGQTDWSGGNPQYTQNLVRAHYGNNRFLSDVLEKLFFDTLNKNREGDIVDPILGEDIKIPYLNGGLFDKDDLDEKDIDFPFEYFEGLMDFFSQYNFTIDENDPYDSEVGIDPEMLGHIFENLLEDNKDKGAYYTPKEIVQYMCRQSLIQYLQSRLGAHYEIEQFINTHQTGNVHDRKKFIVSNAENIEKLLDNIKVCDPAIGSGAFPMGMLNEIFFAKMSLNIAANRTEVKKNIIQNSIYGVDIEQGAVDIARLRFWLSLVVDEETPQPLPNLDYKIMCGNSLLSRYKLDSTFENVFHAYNAKKKKKKEKMDLVKYKALVKNYTHTSNHSEKEQFRYTIEEIKNSFLVELTNHEIVQLQKLRAPVYELESPNIFGGLNTTEKTKLKKLKAKVAAKVEEIDNIAHNALYDNAFEWRFEFPALLDEAGNFTGFDLVIGNPPYLRVQGIRKNEASFADELAKIYSSATGSYDLYAVFVERGLQIIHDNGIVNYIMPVKWTNAAFGKGLRKIISESKAAFQIVNFGAHQVFAASTYTALQWFKRNSELLQYYELDKSLSTNQDLGDYLNSLNLENASLIETSKLDEGSWVLTVGQTSEILRKLDKHPRCIGDLFDKIFQGLATSKDDVYFLGDCKEENSLVVGFSDYLGEKVHIEKELLKPLLKGQDVHRYDEIKTNRCVVFPYTISNGKANLLNEEVLSTLYPYGYAYLKKCEHILRQREKGRFDIDGAWFQFGRKQGILSAEKTKLIAPDISLGGNFAYDVNGEFYQTTTLYGYVKKPEVRESYKVLMAILNSRLCWWFLTNTGTTLANGYFRFKPDYIKPFPVPEKISTVAENALCIIVDYILLIKSLGQDTRISGSVDNTVVISLFEGVIDALVLELYFSADFEREDLEFASNVNKQFSPLMHCDSEKNLAIISASYNKLREMDNIIRNNIKYMGVKMSHILGEIFNSTNYN